MNVNKAGRVNGMKRTSTPTKVKGCVHQRMVNHYYNEKPDHLETWYVGNVAP